jgi:hypothetical protein
MLSGKTLMYIAAELAVEIFFRKMGRVAIEGDGKYIQKQLESRIFKHHPIWHKSTVNSDRVLE